MTAPLRRSFCWFGWLALVAAAVLGGRFSRPHPFPTATRLKVNSNSWGHGRRALLGSSQIPMTRITAILPAAGMGTRMGGETPKQFLELDGAPILLHTLRRLASCGIITEIIVATRVEELQRIAERCRQEKFRQPVRVVQGGASRQESVNAALELIGDDVELVAVHDAVRPFVTCEQVARVIEEARKRGAAILGIPAMDTVKEVKRSSLPQDVALITGTIPRERVVLAQTPQVFRTNLLKEAFAKAAADGVSASDEAGLVERLGYDVYVVHGTERNIKITKPSDMELARFYLDVERGKAHQA
jgi:2-C-methyl-D-erythritol 4-phosphate cytidylyltransferase